MFKTKLIIGAFTLAASAAVITLTLQNNSFSRSVSSVECPAEGDRFCTFAELSEVFEESEDWEIQKRESSNNRVLVSAIHGGGIEQVTSQVADAIAGKKYSLYTFKGKLSRGNFNNLHINSVNFDEPQALSMAKEASIHISIHGAEGDKKKTLLGGLNEDLRGLISDHLEANGFRVKEAPKHLDGDHPNNIVNQTKTGQGVQLELTRAQRKAFFENGTINYSSRNDASNQTEVFKQYTAAIRAALIEYEERNL
ncbi:poly-gamma-glutamate hydrolase family protein [Halobacillus halophilus]|uniref:poly-gamma-glutamate hydrolase family protein n=1 Tax=Halobacillus halophilus TaxID=1570 RepID=UPI001CD3EDCC|nr:poly-gamma-glutamate hydrolase family protein [Halobacillus halophilus]MCA1010263.1 poly-gamma-glutamate hydrolase family protein [Halobacillus halophilus]